MNFGVDDITDLDGTAAAKRWLDRHGLLGGLVSTLEPHKCSVAGVPSVIVHVRMQQGARYRIPPH